ncbi:MAG: hypothetical protein BMS9Abin19_0322 [Gammaproteobacteria bacterium]|nr:MAG: hypothetical protein BMS9Abin19_0322 [Gammaproteobacteria bacterium]
MKDLTPMDYDPDGLLTVNIMHNERPDPDGLHNERPDPDGL